MEVSAIGSITALLDLPKLDTTITSLHNVNGTCDPPQGGEDTYSSAVRIDNVLVFDAKVSADFELDVDIGVTDVTINLADEFADGLGVTLFEKNITDIPSQCLKLDPAGTGLIAATATSSPSASASATPTSAAVALMAGQTNTMGLVLGMLGGAMFCNFL